MIQIRLQTIQHSSTYLPDMPPRASLFSLESDSFRDDKRLHNYLLIVRVKMTNNKQKTPQLSGFLPPPK